MAAETALVITSLTVPMVLEMLSNILNIKMDKLTKYYEVSTAFQQYINSLTADVQQELKEKEYKYTPSTAPRNDYAWATDEIKKRQDSLFKINQEIRQLSEKESINKNQSYVGSDEYWKHAEEMWDKHTVQKWKDEGKLWHKEQPLHAAVYAAWERDNKDRFYDNKAKTTQKNNLKLIELNQKKADLNKPLVNTNPTYMSIQDRERKLAHAQSKKKI